MQITSVYAAIVLQAIAGFICAFAPLGAFAQTLELKGIRLGMSQFEIQDLHGALPIRGLTIAGISSKYPISPDFLNGRMERFAFYFDSSEFDQMLVAVKKKYPAVACTNHRVSNAMGAGFVQTQCALESGEGTLSLSRFVSDVSTSALTLTAREVTERRLKALKAGEKDI